MFDAQSRSTAQPSAGFGRGMLRGLGCTLAVVDRMRQRRRSRRQLRLLDDHLLRDIGIRRSDAVRECTRPFWRS